MDSTEKTPTQNCDRACAAIKASLSAYCANELDLATRNEIDEHLKKCSSCRSDFEEYKKVIDVLLANSSNDVDVPHAISPRKRKRMLWLMSHPFFAFCVTHHRMTALIVSLTTVALIIAALLTIKLVVEREKPVSTAVTIVVEDPAAELPELDPEPQIPME